MSPMVTERLYQGQFQRNILEDNFYMRFVKLIHYKEILDVMITVIAAYDQGRTKDPLICTATIKILCWYINKILALRIVLY